MSHFGLDSHFLDPDRPGIQRLNLKRFLVKQLFRELRFLVLLLQGKFARCGLLFTDEGRVTVSDEGSKGTGDSNRPDGPHADIFRVGLSNNEGNLRCGNAQSQGEPESFEYL